MFVQLSRCTVFCVSILRKAKDEECFVKGSEKLKLKTSSSQVGPIFKRTRFPSVLPVLQGGFWLPVCAQAFCHAGFGNTHQFLQLTEGLGCGILESATMSVSELHLYTASEIHRAGASGK